MYLWVNRCFWVQVCSEVCRWPGTGVTGNCEPLRVGAGNRALWSGRAACTLTAEPSFQHYVSYFWRNNPSGFEKPFKCSSHGYYIVLYTSRLPFPVVNFKDVIKVILCSITNTSMLFIKTSTIYIIPNQGI